MCENVILICLLLNILIVSSQSKTELYVKKYSDLFVQEMKQYKIPSITLSQGILESGNGEKMRTKVEIIILELNVMVGKEKKFMQMMMRKMDCRKYRRVEDSFRIIQFFIK